MKVVNHVLLVVLVLVLAAPSRATAAGHDRCLVNPTGGGSLNTFVFLDMPSPKPGTSVAVQGVFFTGARKLAPFDGSIATSPDGSMLVGLFVHSTALSLNDFTITGLLDQQFTGSLNFDNDGDFVTNGALEVHEVDCNTIDIPWPSTPSSRLLPNGGINPEIDGHRSDSFC